VLGYIQEIFHFRLCLTVILTGRWDVVRDYFLKKVHAKLAMMPVLWVVFREFVVRLLLGCCCGVLKGCQKVKRLWPRCPGWLL